MIGTDKYGGHTPGPWRVEYGDMEQYGETDTVLSGIDVVALDVMRQDAQLITDAPLLLAEVKRLREVISRAINTLLPNPPQDLYELSSTTFAQDIGDLVGFYTEAMGHAIGILEGTE